jgi:putative ABC transport system substrate-binding protein
MIGRRDFIAGIGGAAATWPLAARAQKPGRMRRLGVLSGQDEASTKSKLSALMGGLAELGWTFGQNLQVDVRWTAGDLDRARMLAKELVDLQPDVILAHNTPVVAALQRETRTIPIVFVIVVDPVGSGFVANLPRPGGNITGFINIEGTMAGKCLGLLTEIAPDVKRVAAIFNPDTAPYVTSYYLPSFEDAARLHKVEPIVAPVHSEAEIETLIASLGRGPGGGLFVMPDSYMVLHRTSIILTAARNKVPAIYIARYYASDGGLLSYGPDEDDIFRRSASYLHRILRGAKPADLPVQLPVKFEMVVNAKTAEALGLTIPETLRAIADEVIN